MARGKTHDRVNLICGSIVTGGLIGFERNLLIIIGFIVGFLISTLVISPDLDIGPKKRTKWLQIFLYPYSIFFQHRGYSHSILFGTLTRIIYGLIVFLLIVFSLKRMDYIDYGEEAFLSSLWHFLREFDYSLIPYKFLSWTFFGMFLADILHIILDKISSKWGRFKRKFT